MRNKEGGKDYNIIDQGWDKESGGPIDLNTVHYINNGVDLKDFEYNKEHYTIDDADLLDKSVKKVMYLGSIRLANNVMQLVKAAEVIKDRNDIKFLIYGNGEERTLIESYCHEHDLHNVLLKDKWVEPKFVPYIVSQADVHMLNYMPGDLVIIAVVRVSHSSIWLVVNLYAEILEWLIVQLRNLILV